MEDQELTGFSSRVGSALRILGAWLRLPLSKGGRGLLSWIVGNGVLEAAARTGSLPQLTWSQDGEDLLFSELFPKHGFYVDVGANHPHRYSVTKRLYDLGWRGLNVDFSPEFKTLFDRERPQDINVEALVGMPRTESFYVFEESTLSTLNKARADQLVDLGWKLAKEIKVPVRDLNEILMKNIAWDMRIDLLSIDIEGEEFNALSRLDWARWRIERCLVEIVEPAHLVSSHPVAKILLDQGFELTRVWGRSALFEKNFQADELDRTLV